MSRKKFYRKNSYSKEKNGTGQLELCSSKSLPTPRAGWRGKTGFGGVLHGLSCGSNGMLWLRQAILSYVRNLTLGKLVAWQLGANYLATVK